MQIVGDQPENVVAAALQLLMVDPSRLDATIVDTLGTIGRNEGADRVYVTMYEPDGTFRNSHEWLAEGTPSHQELIVDLLAADFPWSVAIAERGDVLNVGTLDELPPEAAAERHSFGLFGVQSILQVPMFVDGRLRGLIGVNCVRRSGRCSPSTVSMVSAIADAMAVALLRRDHERALAEARDAAVRAAMEKDEFLARVTHELRTPLHAVVGFTELLQLETLPESAQNKVDRIDQAGRHLLSLIGTLIELGSRRSVATVSLPLKLALDRSLDRQRSVAASRSVKLSVWCRDAPVRVRADEHLLAHVLDAVVHDAIVHSHAGDTVEISGEIQGGRCVIRVRDHGLSIDEHIRESALAGALSSGEWVTDGRGVSVAVVSARLLAQRMNAQLQLVNHPDGGVVAELQMPVDER